MVSLVTFLLISFLMPMSDVQVVADPVVAPPVVAQQAQAAPAAADLKQGRIVVHVRNDGTYADEAFEALADENAIAVYVAREKQRLVAQDLEPLLHLRGEKEALFAHGRTAIRAAATAGVSQVIFAAYVVEADDGEVEQPQQPAGERPQAPVEAPRLERKPRGPRDSDLNLVLPGPPKLADGVEAVEIQIGISAAGQVTFNGAVVDGGPGDKDLPQLVGKLKTAVQNHPAGNAGIHVNILADDAVAYQKVIDVLNALAAAGINSVTFTDLTKDGK